jgi:hypothetical protein
MPWTLVGSIAGPVGPTGPTGPTGATGATGPAPSIAGLTGDSAVGDTDVFWKQNAAGTVDRKVTGSDLAAALLAKGKTLRAADGTNTAPGIAFSSDTGTGFYRIGSGQVGFSSAGTLGWTFAGTTLSGQSGSSARITGSAASATNPTLIPNRSATTAGIGANAAGAVDIITGGVSRIAFSSGGIVASGAIWSFTSTVAAPTPTAGDDSQTVATTAFVKTSVPLLLHTALYNQVV